MKKIIIILCIFLQTAVCFAVEKNEDILEDLAKEIAIVIDAAAKKIVDSVHIIITKDKIIYIHDYTTLGLSTFDKSKRVKLNEIDSKVKEFVEKGDEHKLRSVNLIVDKNIHFDYLYKVIKHYETALTKQTGSNLEVSYRLSPLVLKRTKDEKTDPK